MREAQIIIYSIFSIFISLLVGAIFVVPLGVIGFPIGFFSTASACAGFGLYKSEMFDK